MMSKTHFSGLFSNLDTDALIRAELQVKSRPLARYQSEQKAYQQERTTLESLESSISAFQSFMQDFGDPAELRGIASESADESVARISSSSSAQVGTHTVEVNQLAASERKVHAGLASDDALVGAGTFQYTYNGEARTIQTTDTTTLSDLVNLINNDGGNPGVRASLLNYEVDADHVSHLVLSGDDSGSNFAIDLTGTTLAGFQETDFEVTQAAQDAQVRVDGYPSGGWMERSSNTISDVIPGVTLSLTGAGTTTVEVSQSSEALKEKVTEFVDQYNTMMGELSQTTAYNEGSETGGMFQGDATINLVINKLRQAVTGTLEGFSEDGDTFRMLAEIGVEVDRYGVMSVDSAKLDEAISTDYENVLSMFSADNTGTSTNAYLQFSSSMDSTEAGEYEVNVSFDGSGNVTAAQYQDEEGTWHAMAIDGNELTAGSGPAAGLQIKAVWDGSSTDMAATVQLRDGLAATMDERIEEILDSSDGMFALRKKSIERAIDGLDDRIADQQDRVDQYEEYLRDKYARMESALAELENMGSQVESMIASLSTNNKK